MFVLAIIFLIPALGSVFNGRIWPMGFVLAIIFFVIGFSIKTKVNTKP